MRVLVELHFLNCGHPLPELSQLEELAGLLGEEQSEVVDYFVDGEIKNGEVAEVVVVLHALPFVQVHQVGYLFFIEFVELPASFEFFLVGGGTGVADKTKNGVLKVAFGPEIVDFHLVLECFPEEIGSLG